MERSFEWKLKQLENGPFSIQLMHPLHSRKSTNSILRRDAIDLSLGKTGLYYYHLAISLLSANKISRIEFGLISEIRSRYIRYITTWQHRKQRLRILRLRSILPLILISFSNGSNFISEISIRREARGGIGYSLGIERKEFREDRKHVVNKTG